MSKLTSASCRVYFLIWSFLGLAICVSHGQAKYESEQRIKVDQVPVEAVEFIDALDFEGKIKWYREQGINRTSVEAKTKHLGKKYSVEFSESGQIEDVEIKLDWNEIPGTTQQHIVAYLDSMYQRFKLTRIQIQYTGDRQLLIDAIKQLPSSTPEIHYEIVLKAKTASGPQQFEYLFSEQGAVVRRSLIVFRNTDNLEY